ncbi:MAG: hypothetical protein CV089_02065 [Nitrospira sp. WS110]|nr:hypothetical protein [Nitrospira sp. WS110]
MKLTPELIQTIALEYKSGRALASIASEFGVHIRTVRKIGADSGYTREDARKLRFLNSEDGQAAFNGLGSLKSDMRREEIRATLAEAENTVTPTVYPEKERRWKLKGKRTPTAPKATGEVVVLFDKRVPRNELRAQLIREERDEDFFAYQENVA